MTPEARRVRVVVNYDIFTYRQLLLLLVRAGLLNFSPGEDPNHPPYEVLQVRPSADEKERQTYSAPPEIT